MRLRSALLATSLLAATPFAAKATTITGPYVDIGGGYNLTQTQHGHFADTNSGAGVPGEPGREKLGHRHGWTGFGAVGWGFGNGLRAEVEGDYNWSEIYSKSRGDKGSDRSYGGFVNVLYDIDLKRLFSIDVPVTPFVGVGAGYLWQGDHNITVGANNPSGARSLSGTKGGFAYQGIVGAAYDIPGVPGLQMTTEYRMIGQPQSFTMGNFTAGDGHASFDHRFNHQFIVGVRYAFNNAPPPPPPAPAVVPPAPTAARTYLVFFDWDGAALTGRAREIVAEAAQASTHIQTTRIEVNGYTDNSAAHPGPRGEKYNLGLSLRRADSVKAELIRDGVPANAIDIHGYGEAHPLVPTGPDTREPQNRRVEIILH
ncbi:OmpA family protein [Komagataeibacter sp. FNDCR2]|uniref:OmpA family protein n=1 Tax=Komagataeibacter sp. FNDCR2 TaxID=2878682 RepID=UPI001E47B309|nr:OmpA family protein [Komagataeibacter sp. FNDCR2]MCE2576340.1 OmpA family protein [Komagataeibacter sp. FNDCR2]